MKKITSIIISLLLVITCIMPVYATDSNDYGGASGSFMDINEVYRTWLSDDVIETIATNENFKDYYFQNKDKHTLIYCSTAGGYFNLKVYAFQEGFTADNNFVHLINNNNTLTNMTYAGYQDDFYGSGCSIQPPVNNEGFIVVHNSELFEAFKNINPNAHIYDDVNPIQSLYKYCGGLDGLFNPITAPDGYTMSSIILSEEGNNPYSDFGSFYENQIHDYETCGLFSKFKLYYNNNFNIGSSFEHDENIIFYYDVSLLSSISHLLNKDVNYIIDNINLDEFFNDLFKVVHYKRTDYTPLKFFNRVLGTSYDNYIHLFNNGYFSLNKDENLFNGNLYLTFTVKSQFSLSYTDNENNLTGKMITHNASYINNKYEIGLNDMGLGSDLSQADPDRSRPYTKKELAEMGFTHGYINTEGSFPYIVTIYRNGTEYLRYYLNKMPFVASTYYSNKCIQYSINVSDVKTYVYFVQQNMSKLFDFTKKIKDDDWYNNQQSLNSGDKILDIFADNVLKPLAGASAEAFNRIFSINTSDFNNTYSVNIWTNYIGTLPSNYNGFYTKYNWDLEQSGKFLKNNSDDNYNYSDDYIPSDIVVDNNGNSHGNAVEIPTTVPDTGGNTGGNNGMFETVNFELSIESLYNYGSLFFNFCKNTFLLLPNFIWLMIASAIGIVIVLRVMGR